VGYNAARLSVRVRLSDLVSEIVDASGSETLEGYNDNGYGEHQLILDLDGFEGPLDILLTLSRSQKVDLSKISILELAEQYLLFISRARELKLEIAADYLVMAAWLAYIKSRLLLPDIDEDIDEPSGEEMAESLSRRLRHLEGIRILGKELMKQPRLGLSVFSSGVPTSFKILKKVRYEASLYDLLKSYSEHKLNKERGKNLHIISYNQYSIEDAYSRLSLILEDVPKWETLSCFLPSNLRGVKEVRAAVAATFAASLELAREGKIELRQNKAFGRIHLRRYPTDSQN